MTFHCWQVELRNSCYSTASVITGEQSSVRSLLSHLLSHTSHTHRVKPQSWHRLSCFILLTPETLPAAHKCLCLSCSFSRLWYLMLVWFTHCLTLLAIILFFSHTHTQSLRQGFPRLWSVYLQCDNHSLKVFQHGLILLKVMLFDWAVLLFYLISSHIQLFLIAALILECFHIFF